MIVVYRDEQPVPSSDDEGQGSYNAIARVLLKTASRPLQLNSAVFIRHSDEPFLRKDMTDEEHFEERSVSLPHRISQLALEHRATGNARCIGLACRIGTAEFATIDSQRADMAVRKHVHYLVPPRFPFVFPALPKPPFDEVDSYVYFIKIVAHIVHRMEEDYLQKLGMKIRKLRLEQDLSQDKLALMIGSTEGKAYISRIELGKANISINVLYRIATALGVKARDLIDF